MLSRTGALRIAAVEARSVQGDGGRVAAGGPVHARKQRHTAKRVYDRLVSEKGYEGSYSPVQRYVKRWREEHRLPSDGYLELKWHPGEAQVDFGMAQAVVGGDRVDVHCLVVTFPYSNMRYCVALPGENAECVCAGLRTVFEHIGAVPLTLVLDNATGAGHRIAWDKVTVVHVFELFVEHYLCFSKLASAL